MTKSKKDVTKGHQDVVSLCDHISIVHTNLSRKKGSQVGPFSQNSLPGFLLGVVTCDPYKGFSFELFFKNCQKKQELVNQGVRLQILLLS
jgi:hypothetical protein